MLNDPLGEMDSVVIVHEMLLTVHTGSREDVYLQAIDLDPVTAARVITAAVTQLYSANEILAPYLGMTTHEVLMTLVNRALELRERRDHS